MGNFSTNVFLVIFMWNLWSCSNANGLNGCECNIMDACNAQGNPKSNWTQYLPSGVDKFRYVVRGAQNLAYLCENRKYAYAVAILFDCNSRIPLYAATVMTGQQLSAGKIPRPDEFEQSNEVKMTYQSKADDYHRPKRPEPWKAKPNCANPKETSEKIDRGHLIASQYGRGDKKRMAATFTYTNIVPQFGRFNNGPWNKCESRLIKWGQKNCARNGAQNVKLFIVVGAIPSTVNAPTIPGKPKFFGKRGFCDKQDNADYRVNVPKLLWTAACCTFEEDVNGNWTTGTHSTAFWGQNVPGGSSCEKIDIPALTNKLSGMIRGKIKLFPLSSQCYNNYIPL